MAEPTVADLIALMRHATGAADPMVRQLNGNLVMAELLRLRKRIEEMERRPFVLLRGGADAR